MSKSVSKHRKKLNEQQLVVLELLYRFRFGSNELFAQYFGKKDNSLAYKRLSVLIEQGLVGKRFEGSYRIQGRPAAYYLTPEGARRLQEARDDLRINIKTIYKDAGVSEQFVSYRMELFAIHNQLKAQYGDALSFFTASDLNNDDFDYFPRPLPDAYIQLKTEDGEKQFFLDVFHDDQPYFVAVRKILQYIKYDEEADWVVTETDLPVILAVCESSGPAKRVRKRMIKALKDAWSDNEVVFALAAKGDLLGDNRSVWELADEPDEKLSLLDIS